jgi:hypothetical protein
VAYRITLAIWLSKEAPRGATRVILAYQATKGELLTDNGLILLAYVAGSNYNI